MTAPRSPRAVYAPHVTSTGPSTMVAVRALDVPLDIVIPRLLEDHVREIWHLCLDERRLAGDVRTVIAKVPEGADGTEDVWASVLQSLTQAVTLAAIEARAGSAVMFHAGGLCNPTTGASIAYVAPGGTGKTTLTRVLGPGRGYLSDETIAIGEDLRIDVYPKPLSLRRAGSAIKDETDPRTLGLSASAVSPWLAGLVVLVRDLPPGGRVEVEEVPVLDAIAMLAPESSSLASLATPLRRMADVI